MAFCTNCGSKIDDEARFCPDCGAEEMYFEELEETEDG